MAGFFRKNRMFIIAAVILICLAAAYSMYRESRMHLLNRSEMSALARDIRQAADSGEFTGQQELTDYIVSWAEENGVEYRKDAAGNIVCISKAVERKKKQSPTVICVSYNYETAAENSILLASAAMIAKSDLRSGRKTVIFVSDENNTGAGYSHLSRKLFRGSPKVIYLDYGNSSYMSCSSFGKKHSYISVKAGRYRPECDTAVRVRITGIRTSVIGLGISRHPDPINELSNLLTRLKSKSAIFQLADFDIDSRGDMYPVSMDATILMNSYAVSSFTKYIDKRIRTWDRTYSGDYGDMTYSYEVISDPEEMPRRSYSRSATTKLTNVLYTLKYGLYQYAPEDEIPEGRSANDVYGINAVTGLRAEDGEIRIDLLTQAYDDGCMDSIMSDNTAAAELFEADITETDDIPVFLNDRDSLQRTFRSTYFKVNSISSTSILETMIDSCFTPCSYLAEKNSRADIIHLRLNAEQAQTLTNTILCYIAFKGNILL